MLQVHEPSGAEAESRRDANGRARDRRILDAAQDLINDGGLAALSMRRLGRAADVSVTTLYNRFGGKDGVLAAMIDAALDDMDRRLDEEAPTASDPFGRCRAVITVSIEHLAARPEVYRSVNLVALERLARREPDDRRLARRAAGMQMEGLVAAREQGLLRADIDLEALASQIYHGYELASMQWAHGHLDAGGFEARALYGLWVALLAACVERERPAIERELAAAATTLHTKDTGLA